jgi:hypothetical protein
VQIESGADHGTTAPDERTKRRQWCACSNEPTDKQREPNAVQHRASPLRAGVQ